MEYSVCWIRAGVVCNEAAAAANISSTIKRHKIAVSLLLSPFHSISFGGGGYRRPSFRFKFIIGWIDPTIVIISIIVVIIFLGTIGGRLVGCRHKRVNPNGMVLAIVIVVVFVIVVVASRRKGIIMIPMMIMMFPPVTQDGTIQAHAMRFQGSRNPHKRLGIPAHGDTGITQRNIAIMLIIDLSSGSIVPRGIISKMVKWGGGGGG